MEKIRPAFSLRWKILAWFFLNLLLVGGILFLFVRVQFRIGVNSLLAGPTSDRLEAVARPLAAEMRRQPPAEWAAALDRAVAAWRGRGVRAALFRNNGTYLAGDIRELPADVSQVLDQHDHRRFPGGQPPARRSPLDDLLGPARTGEVPATGQPPPVQPNAGPLEKFMLIAGDPKMYWAGVHLGDVQPSQPGGPPPAVTLLLASDSLRGGGLFFDYAPWLALALAMVLVSMLLWLPLIHNLTRALTRMTQAAEGIAQGRFDTPHFSRRRDEIGRLSRALGHMATQLEIVLTGQKRFLGDTAHELLSPLARLEVALSIIEQRTAGTDNSRYLDKALNEVRHISSLVRELLSFTKAGLRNQPPELRPLLLAEVVREAVEREGATAKVTVDIPAHCYVLAAHDLLARAIANAVRNAVRYAGTFGPIEIGAEAAGDDGEGVALIALSIGDQGPGVPPEALDRLFDPFFRPESDRARATGGVGLGLAIVKTCVEACGGHVAIHNREPQGLQLTFTLRSAG